MSGANTKMQILLALLAGFCIGFFAAFSYMESPDWITRHWDHHMSHEMGHLVGLEIDVGSHKHNEEFHKHEDNSVAKQMKEEVRVLCWIMTTPLNHEKRAKHVRNTWGKRCNVLLFMSSAEDASLPSVALPVGEGRNNLWGKTKEAFKYAYNNYYDKADWFLKADDDTYVVVENLRYMLQPHNPNQPIYFGCKFKPYVKQGYMSGGAGYVLSREALKRFVEVGVSNRSLCRHSTHGNEDVEMGKCMQNLKVDAGDTRDKLGRGRFFPFLPEDHLIPEYLAKQTWYSSYIFYDINKGMDCCSDNAVSFHYVKPNQMYVLEYLIYHLRPYGITYTVPTVYNNEIESHLLHSSQHVT